MKMEIISASDLAKSAGFVVARPVVWVDRQRTGRVIRAAVRPGGLVPLVRFVVRLDIKTSTLAGEPG
jgi:hypothetical protein